MMATKNDVFVFRLNPTNRAPRTFEHDKISDSQNIVLVVCGVGTIVYVGRVNVLA